MLKKANEKVFKTFSELGAYLISNENFDFHSGSSPTSTDASESSSKISNYFGEFDTKTGKNHGQGVHLDSNGCIYEGSWKDGKKQGVGRYITPTSVYCGNWNDDFATGTGVLTGKPLAPQKPLNLLQS